MRNEVDALNALSEELLRLSEDPLTPSERTRRQTELRADWNELYRAIGPELLAQGGLSGALMMLCHRALTVATETENEKETKRVWP